MQFEDLANELVLHIFRSCNTVEDVLNLASTCRHFRRVFGASQKLPLLYQAAENSFGPLGDAIQVATHNGSQPAHLIRSAPLSLALLQQLLKIGNAAKGWEEIYPAKKWKDNFEDRRLLTSVERYRLRRAVYRLWLYSKAFHNIRYPRSTRMHKRVVLERAELLHNWTTSELAEIEDMRCVIRDVLRNHVCPSNSSIQRKFRKRFPESDQQLLFNIHLNYPPSAPSAFHKHFHTTHQISSSAKFFPGDAKSAYHFKYTPTAFHEPGCEGWGDDIPHYYVIEDMQKLDPGQIIWLKENAPLKAIVEDHVSEMGDWFRNNGETFGQTLEWISSERGEDVEEMRAGIDNQEMGIIC
ncbi:hypothetical protein MMC19_001794 [Ptychographa xylographoides]|nr:hypothetical protein [Ptychographa xylographoides]